MNDDLHVSNDPATDDQWRERELRLLAERFHDCAEIGPQWFWEVDRNLHYTYISDRGLEILGGTADTLYGRSRAELPMELIPTDEDEWRRYRVELEARRPFYKVRYLMRRPNMADVNVMTSAKPYHDEGGAFAGYRGVSVDITEQVKAETQLRAAIEAIEDGFAYFDSEERFVLCNSKYLDFYPNAGRILQPGTTFEDIVRNGITRGLVRANTPNIEDYVQRRLKQFRTGSQTFDAQIEDVVAPPLIAECVDMLKEKAYEVDVTLIDDSDADLIPLATDRGRFRQIMLNLLSNAVKYNRPGGTVTVTTLVLNDTIHNTGMVRVSVADTGDGIPHERQEQIFQAFNRLGREGSSIEGTGIGLYLTNRLVEQLGGAIGFESTPGVGTTFWVDFPAGGVARSAVRGANRVGPRGTAPAADADGYFTVLYIEDNPLHRLLMEEVFTDLTNARLVTANDAESGIETATTLRPSLILMDIDLPGMSGFEARKRLADIRETASIPVVALTAGAPDFDMQQGLDAGFSDYLTKPFDIGRLIEVIERFTSAKRT